MFAEMIKHIKTYTNNVFSNIEEAIVKFRFSRNERKIEKQKEKSEALQAKQLKKEEMIMKAEAKKAEARNAENKIETKTPAQNTFAAKVNALLAAPTIKKEDVIFDNSGRLHLSDAVIKQAKGLRDSLKQAQENGDTSLIYAIKNKQIKNAIAVKAASEKNVKRRRSLARKRVRDGEITSLPEKDFSSFFVEVDGKVIETEAGIKYLAQLRDRRDDGTVIALDGKREAGTGMMKEVGKAIKEYNTEKKNRISKFLVKPEIKNPPVKQNSVTGTLNTLRSNPIATGTTPALVKPRLP